jgi:hypothetical protein
MPYSLVRERDGAGDSGGMSLAITPKTGGNHRYEHGARPRVGVVMRVGSMGARSYSAQDWWQTTVITEILDEWNDGDDTDSVIECVRFKTGNSVYVWKKF